ncbi:MAG TPA: hypothetical protein VJM31_12570 [Vicinamibacterales bacterium]|nr:hypothetical protein [Vicinamibacterales bacterium]
MSTSSHGIIRVYAEDIAEALVGHPARDPRLTRAGTRIHEEKSTNPYLGALYGQKRHRIRDLRLG